MCLKYFFCFSHKHRNFKKMFDVGIRYPHSHTQVQCQVTQRTFDAKSYPVKSSLKRSKQNGNCCVIDFLSEKSEGILVSNQTLFQIFLEYLLYVSLHVSSIPPVHKILMQEFDLRQRLGIYQPYLWVYECRLCHFLYMIFFR